MSKPHPSKEKLQANAERRNAHLREIAAVLDAARCPTCDGVSFPVKPQRLLRLQRALLTCKGCDGRWYVEVPPPPKPQDAAGSSTDAGGVHREPPRHARHCPIDLAACLSDKYPACCRSTRTTAQQEPGVVDYECRLCGFTQSVLAAPSPG